MGSTSTCHDGTSLSDFEGDYPLIVFDGVCVLCSGLVRVIVRLDRQKYFRFVMAQSPVGEALYRRHGLRTDFYETNLVIIKGSAFTRMDTIIAICDQLGWPWRAIRVLNILPRRLRDWLYDQVARNRYTLFGKKDSCAVPSAELRSRIVG
jgi:predicted DCC family thiol-disulfide oxidoreductase YuxK